MINTLPGDLLFCHGSSMMAKAIRWASRSKNEEKTWTNHVAGIGQRNTIIEAGWVVVEYQPAPEFFETCQVWRNTTLTPEQRIAVAKAARAYLGRRYGGAKILLHLGDAILSKVFGGNPYMFRRLAKMDQYPICSWVWAFAYFNALHISFGVSPYMITPDDMLDFCQESPDWSLITC